MMDLISVIMGVFNCEKTIELAIKSIQDQTYQNWELIICDDGSRDNTYQIIEKLADEDRRIILLKNENNMGLNKTLNKCLKCAHGEFIARMDGDDISLSTRLEKELNFLKNHGEYELVSTPMFLFDENGVWGQTDLIEKPSKEDVVTGSPICHAPVMIRKKCLDEVKGYTVDKKTMRVEDVDLWIKLYRINYRCYNLKEPLYKMKNDKNAVSRRKYRYRINSVYVRLRGCRQMNLGWKCYVKSFQPAINGLVPGKLRQWIKKKINRKGGR